MGLGGRNEVDALVSRTYDQLRTMARRHLAAEQPGHTLQATALVHEAYLRLLQAGAPAWKDRTHFLASFATAVRHVLIDHARRRRRLKRGGQRRRLEPPEAEAAVTAAAEEAEDDRLLALEEALRSLERADRRMAALVELRFFAGLTVDEAALVLGVSPSTVARDWRVARAWLRSEMEEWPR